MTISIDVSGNIEKALREHGADLNCAAKETLLIGLYREGKLFHSDLARALGMSRYEVDGLLKRHGVFHDLSEDELRADVEGLRKIASP
jgi:predicted HTH domain antitoxin